MSSQGPDDQPPAEPVPTPDFLGLQVTEGHEWVEFAGAPLSQPVEVKFRLGTDGRAQIVGLRIDNGQAISAKTLREPRLGAMEKRLSDFIREHRRQIASERSAATERMASEREPAAVRETQGYLGWIEIYEARVEQALARVRSDDDTGAKSFASRGRGAKPPSEQDYLRFSQVYLEQLAQHPSGPVQATASVVGMNRSTVYRWLGACRQRGYLPPGGER